MTDFLAEKALARFLALGAFLVTVFIWTASGSDPVNVTKLWLAGGIAGGSLAIAVRYSSKSSWGIRRVTILISILFVIAMINALVQSEAPLSQTVFGVYGRNSGFLSYMVLLILMISITQLSKIESYSKLLIGLAAGGAVNILYCGWVITFGDFVPWNNQYKNILGTFGNPDFISAFLGMFVVLVVSAIFSNTVGLKIKILGVLSSILAIIEILKSHAIQGLVVTVGGIVLVGFFLIRSKFKSTVPQFGYVAAALFLGILGVLGTLQKGPLSFIYKKSVSLRGSYWHAGIEMGNTHPFSGVGMDTYGDWYRAMRPPVALIDTPPISVVSNVSHNVFIDFYASGGWPLLLTYAALVLLAFSSLLKLIFRKKSYDSTFVGLATLWACYQVQSVISINQMGLAIWGWLLNGALIGYEIMDRKNESSSESLPSSRNSKQGIKQNVVSPNLVGGIGLALGLVLSFPPLNADVIWRSALDSRNLSSLEAALQPSLFNPADSNKYAQSILTLKNSNLNEIALKYTLQATKFNENNTEAWLLLYSNPSASDAQKSIALKNMKRLDPKNPNVLGLNK